MIGSMMVKDKMLCWDVKIIGTEMVKDKMLCWDVVAAVDFHAHGTRK
jgi:hypothetical protein